MTSTKISDPKLDRQLAAVALKVERAAPKTSSAVLSLFTTLFLPALPAIVSELVKRAGARTQGILRQVRSVLDEADLGDEPEEEE